MIRIVLSSEAEADALDAFRFYEGRRDGLGERFRDHLGLARARLQLNPEEAPVVYRNLRRKLVQRFPFMVLYQLFPGILYVIAIMHAKQTRRPGNVEQAVAGLANKPSAQHAPRRDLHHRPSTRASSTGSVMAS